MCECSTTKTPPPAPVVSERVFTLDWKYGHTTMDGRPARIVATDRVGLRPVVALVMQEHGAEMPYSYRTDGMYESYSLGMDLVNAPAPKKKVTVYAFVCISRSGNRIYSTSHLDKSVVETYRNNDLKVGGKVSEITSVEVEVEA